MTDKSIADRGLIKSRSSRPARGGAAAPRRLLQPLGLPWVLPALVFTIGVIYFGVGYTGYASTLDWNGLSPNPPSVGAGNYIRIFQDPVFWQSLQHTVVFFVVGFVIQTALGITFAVLLHSKVKFAVIYKIIIFVPVVLAPAIMAPVFRQFYGANGQFNWLLDHIGLGFLTQPWLAQSSTALGVIIAIQIWQFTGLTFVLYFAAMGQIDTEVLEAARIDGASNLRILVSIIWPGVWGTTVALAMLTAIGSLKTFDIPYLVTIGGPNFSTEFLGTYIYRISIPQAHVGYGSALSVLLLILALTMAILLQSGGREKKGKNL
ncbi:MAG: sugar transporter permease [Rhodoglobus sp.]|nr:sugar transporter permease [Rhodoglobus sp.]